MAVAVLALQGDFEAHRAALTRAGIACVEARTAAEVLAADALVLPGGESTTMWKLMEGTGIPEAIVGVARSGRPVYGTCAGAILLSREIRSQPGEVGRPGLGLLDTAILRNAYGRQLDSAVVALTDVSPELGPGPHEGVFIRAPRFESLGAGVDVLARRDGAPVLVRQGSVLAATFHPELSGRNAFLETFLTTAPRKAKAA